MAMKLKKGVTVNPDGTIKIGSGVQGVSAATQAAVQQRNANITGVPPTPKIVPTGTPQAPKQPTPVQPVNTVAQGVVNSLPQQPLKASSVGASPTGVSGNLPGANWAVVGKQSDPNAVSTYLNSQPGFKTTVSGNTVTGTKNGEQKTWIFNGTDWVVKPPIATSENPVVSVPDATIDKHTPIETTQMTPDQLKAKYLEISSKLPGEVTDEDRRFINTIKARMSLGETSESIFGTGTSKSSGTTTYSPELVQPGENIASSVRNPDGTYTVTYKDGTTQQTSSKPSETVFPEGTPEYFAQKREEAAQKQIDTLNQQIEAEKTRREEETKKLVEQYGADIGNRFAEQKRSIEEQGAKRMDTLNTGLSFSGFGRSTLALDKRDEIAANIQETVNAAKSKADLELAIFEAERRGADEEAISSMRKGVAEIQKTIDDANYKNQIAILDANEKNNATADEAMMNMLAVLSDSSGIMNNADLDKSRELGYFVNKKGDLITDTEGRAVEFKGSASGLKPDQIQAYADAIKKGIIKVEDLDKTVTPAQKADILKKVAVDNGTWTGATGGDISTASGDLTSLRSQYPREAWSGTNNPTGLTVSSSFSKKLQDAGIEFTTKPRPSNEGGEYYVFSDIADGLKAHNIALKTSGWQDIWKRMYTWSAGGTKDTPQAEKEANKRAYADRMLAEAGIAKGTTFDQITPEQEAKLLSAHIKKESPNLYKVLTSGQGGGGTLLSNLSKEAQAIINQINTQGGKPQDYILGTSADSQKLLQEVLQGLNTQGGTGTLASETRKQSLDLALNTITDLLGMKDMAGSMQTRKVGETGPIDSLFNLTANENVNFVNRVDALAGQLLQIDGPTLKAMFGPQISNSDVEAIKRTILQGLDPKNQNPAAFEKSLNDVKAKMQAYLNRLPQNQGTAPASTTTQPSGDTSGNGII